MEGGDPSEHVVQKGETLSGISQKYGVSVDWLQKVNGIKNKDKIKAGSVLNVNPESNFSNNPEGGYKNSKNSEGTDVQKNTIFSVATDFILGVNSENYTVTQGEAIETVKNWDKVQELISKGIDKINSDDKIQAGETFSGRYNAPKLLKWAAMAFIGQERPITPIHIIGSFSLTMRVDASKSNYLITLYDSKSISSLSDNYFGKSFNMSRDYPMQMKPFSTQYVRFTWTQKYNDDKKYYSNVSLFDFLFLFCF